MTSQAHDRELQSEQDYLTDLYDRLDGKRRRVRAQYRAALGGPLQRLTLIAPTIYGRLQWTVDRGERWKFWKKGRPPAALAAHLAGQIENT